MGFAPTFYFWPEAMQDTAINDRVSEIAASAANLNGVEFVRSEIIGSKRNPTFRVYIDKPEGVTLDDCSVVSHAIEAVLEADDFISQAYVLEVSSPGLERELYSLADFERFAGHKAKVRLTEEHEGRKSFSGRIIGVEGDEIVFEDRTAGGMRFGFDSIAKANLRIDLESEFKRKR